jgi:hypothetical protein
MRGWKQSFTARGKLREEDDGPVPKMTIIGVFNADLRIGT